MNGAWYALFFGWHPPAQLPGLVSTWRYHRLGDPPETKLITINVDGVYEDGELVELDEALALWMMRRTVQLIDDGWSVTGHRAWNEPRPPHTWTESRPTKGTRHGMDQP
ncbi:hypothetical protein J5X84_35990 [Streptosporangiaceae bacterium NEAU-GS5]|nr:hypothetical protein [Streptosporangiaceae bacterium NEAU-GS5]